MLNRLDEWAEGRGLIPPAQVVSTPQVVVTDIHMPFWSMVGFMVKWAVASIPAIFIMWIIGIVFWTVLGASVITWLLAVVKMVWRRLFADEDPLTVFLLCAALVLLGGVIAISLPK